MRSGSKIRILIEKHIKSKTKKQITKINKNSLSYINLDIFPYYSRRGVHILHRVRTVPFLGNGTVKSVKLT